MILLSLYPSLSLSLSRVYKNSNLDRDTRCTYWLRTPFAFPLMPGLFSSLLIFSCLFLSVSFYVCVCVCVFFRSEYISQSHF